MELAPIAEPQLIFCKVKHFAAKSLTHCRIFRGYLHHTRGGREGGAHIFLTSFHLSAYKFSPT